VTRVIIFTGKGGVGKTTCAAATALRTASLGKKTLVLSSDPAQALSESMDTKLGTLNPKELRSNLWGLEINTQAEVNVNYGDVRDFLIRLFQSRGIDLEIASEMAVLPGMDEIFSILTIEKYLEEFDVIVLDTAPTGHTFRLLALPQVFSMFGKTFMKMGSGLSKFLQQTGLQMGLEQATRTPIPTDRFFDQMRSIMDRVEHVHEILAQADTTVRIATNLEKMPIQEAERSLTFMSLYGLLVDAIAVNKIYPEVLDDDFKTQTGSYFDKWIELQKGYLRRVQHSFHPLKVLKCRLMQEEVIGFDLLEEVATDLYGPKGDPTEKFTDKKAIEFSTDQFGNIVIKLEIPFAKRGKTRIRKKGEELIVEIGNDKRIILLPDYALSLKVKKAYYEGQVFFIVMGSESDSGFSVPID